MELLEKMFKDKFAIFENQKKLNSKKPFVYLDSAATSLKPKVVVDAIVDYYNNYSANIHRGIYDISDKTTIEYEKVRSVVSGFINCSSEEAIFTSGTTDSLNGVSRMLEPKIGNEDVIILSMAEHHANIVCWQEVCLRKGAKLVYVGLDDNGAIDIDDLKSKFDEFGSRAKVVSVSHISNVLGVVNDVSLICKLARECGAISVIDAAQSICHVKIDVKEIGCDFLAFSGHKMFGPTGIGVLFGREELLLELEPFRYGGSMISNVELEKSSWAELPNKFEGGTANIAGVIGLGAAIKFIDSVGIGKIHEHGREILDYAKEKLLGVGGVKVYGGLDSSLKIPIVSFEVKGVHPHDVAQILSNHGVCVRAGHHCAQPLVKSFGVNSLTRASFQIYNTKEDVDKLVEGIRKALEVFK